jgi:preprotein translocase subunit SecB
MEDKTTYSGNGASQETQNTYSNNGDSVDATGTKPSIIFKGQYVKNSEFNGPGLSRQIKGEPKTDLNFNIKTTEVEPDIHEVDLNVTAEVATDKEKIITLHVNYGVLYQLKNVPQEQQEGVLITEGGRLVFPYVQRLVGDIMREGGLASFQLPPIDFLRAYKKQRGK